MPRDSDYVEGEPRADNRSTGRVGKDGRVRYDRPSLGSGAAERAAEATEKRNARTRRSADDAMAAMPWNQKKRDK